MLFDPITELAPQIISLINNSHEILIGTHVGADPDSLGSALSLKHILENLGKNVTVFSTEKLNPEITRFPEIYPGVNEVLIKNIADISWSDFDLLICPDCENLNRLTRLEEVILPVKIPILVIDHHPSNKSFGQINLVIPEGTCTAEIVYLLSLKCNWQINPPAAVCLFAGLFSDTGQFIYSGSVSPQTFKSALDLVNLGHLNVPEVAWKLKSIDPRVLECASFVIANARMLFNSKVAIFKVDYEILARFNVPPEYIDSIKEYICNNFSFVLNTSIISVIYQKKPEAFKISLRSNNLSEFRDVSVIARKIKNGGGHPHAAAADVNMSAADAEKLLINLISQSYPELGTPS